LFFGFEYDDNILDVETILHERFSDKKIQGEWYALDAKDLYDIINQTNCAYSSEFYDLINELDSWGYFELFEIFSGMAYRNMALASLDRMDSFYCQYPEKIKKNNTQQKIAIIKAHDEIFN